MLGYLAPEFLAYKEALDGRVAQIVEVFCDSSSTKKNEYSRAFRGVCRAVLLDFGGSDDIEMESMLSDLDSVQSNE